MKVVKDDPHMKAFFIPYVQPQKPAERRKVLMEYDWEEPDRQYGYNFAGKYEDFTFRLIVPEYLQIKPAIHSIRESGKAIESTLLQEEQYISSVVGGNLILEWHSMDVPPLSVYRFDW